MMEFKPHPREVPNYNQTTPANQQQPAPPSHNQQQPASVHPQLKSKKARLNLSPKWLKLIILALALGLSCCIFVLINTKNQLNELKNPPLVGKTEVEQIINQVSKSVALPSEETPVLSTLKDVSKLNGLAYRDAQNGDKVLAYRYAGKAVIYRPSTKKVIVFTFINTESNN